MTTEHEALVADTEGCGVCNLHFAIHPRYGSLDALERAVERGDGAHPWIAPSTAALIRAQVDEDVRRLVAAASLVDDHIWCECVIQPPPHEDILCKPHKALRSALEPFKAVASTEEAARG